MSDVYAAPTRAQRAEFRTRYLEYLRARDGVPDLATHRFDTRERFFRAFEDNPVAWDGPSPIEQDVFDRNHVRERPERGLDAVTLWALCTAKVNRAERYGVGLALERIDASGQDGVLDDPRVYAGIEEHYHTRILTEALRAVGVEASVRSPRWPMRALIHAMVALPHAVADVIVLCGEIAGVAAFRLLLEEARTLFAEQPRVLARLEALFAEIIVDQVGHVTFLRSRLGPVRLEAARRLLPIVADAVLRDVPELELLVGRSRFMALAMRADIDDAAAGYAARPPSLEGARLRD